MTTAADMAVHPGTLVAETCPAKAERLGPEDEARAGLRLVTEAPGINDTRRGWNPEKFAEQQVRGLIQRVFFPGWPRPSRQVVFTAVDQATDTAGVCARVIRGMAVQLPGTVCGVEANLRSPGLENALACGHQPSDSPKLLHVADNLWLLTSGGFLEGRREPFSSVWLRSRLNGLRREFHYTVIHAPVAGGFSEAALLGQLADGVILVLAAHATRRAAAQQTKEILQVANARLLGTVLSERTFPIPEMLYRNL